MKAFRIALARYGRTAREAFSGMSGYCTDGRWHAAGRHLDYAAEHLSLAILERLVHYKRVDDLQAHVLCTLDLPEAVIHAPTSAEIPPGWDGLDLLPAAQAVGNAWHDHARSPALRVPSAVTPGEFNLLINARHAAWDWDWASAPVPIRLDARLEELVTSAKHRSFRR
ncbi:MAG: RES family NAD+ phosphorylase [Verrucomicrobiales bacterium]|nr:RES family NAD+ phosphorylase [Verrucomicrobiales bacterium]